MKSDVKTKARHARERLFYGYPTCVNPQILKYLINNLIMMGNGDLDLDFVLYYCDWQQISNSVITILHTKWVKMHFFKN